VDEDCDGLVNEVDSGRGCIYDIHLSHWSQIDFASNLDHCGQCRNRCCPSPSECEGDRCNNGTCRCNGGPACQGRPTNACCGPSGCIDLTTNLEHCGQCGKRCAPGEYCRADHERVAVCVCPHEPDQGACDNSPGGSCCPGAGCVNINTDVDHCGRCGNDCAAGPRPQGDSCSNGNCRCGPNREQCAPGQWCTGVLNPEEGSCGCANLMEDEEHCGNCWTQCDTNETCQSGTCRCGSGGSNCRGQPNNFCCGGSSCVNLVSDENNCGTCGNRCRPGEQCQNGQCRCANGCNDGNRCTEDFCYPGSNRCGHSPKDSDNDGYCDETCCPGGRCPSGCRHTKGDCNDSAANVNPGADEACFILGSDRDCDGNRAPFDSDCSPF
jgi:hypothetical protein